jgi:hypothetical protein
MPLEYLAAAVCNLQHVRRPSIIATPGFKGGRRFFCRRQNLEAKK